jgi:8-oxo-dGTP diphosphatase
MPERSAILAVTAGVVVRDNTVLVVQRKPTSRRGLLWEFPGGKVEEGEDPRACLKRELEEELGVEVVVGRRFEIVYHTYEDVKVLLISFICQIARGEPHAIDCQSLRWMTQGELRDLPMTAADIPLRDALCSGARCLESPVTLFLGRP